MFRLIAIDLAQKSPHFSLLSPTSPCELSEREITSPSNLKVVGALDRYSLVFVIFINFFRQLKDWVGQVLFLVSCPKGQVEKYVNVEACSSLKFHTNLQTPAILENPTFTVFRNKILISETLSKLHTHILQLKLLVRNPFMARFTRYNFIW